MSTKMTITTTIISTKGMLIPSPMLRDVELLSASGKKDKAKRVHLWEIMVKLSKLLYISKVSVWLALVPNVLDCCSYFAELTCQHVHITGKCNEPLKRETSHTH